MIEYSKFATTLLSRYPRVPEPLQETPSIMNPYDGFYYDWDLSHNLNGLLGEVLELCTIQFNAPAENRTTFLITETIKELGDILFYLVGLIDKTPGLMTVIKHSYDSHVIEFPNPAKLKELNDAMAFFTEQAANLYKRHLYYGDPKSVLDIPQQPLANKIITILRTVKLYGNTALDIADTFHRLENGKVYNGETYDNRRQARELVANHPSLFADPRGLITIMAANQTKLEKRYPSGSFSLQDAIDRKDMEYAHVIEARENDGE